MEFGRLCSWEQQGNRIEFTFENGSGRLEVVTDRILNIFSGRVSNEHRSKAIEGEKAVETRFSASEENGVVTVSTDCVTAKVCDGFFVDFYKADGTVLCRDRREARKVRAGLSDELKALKEAEGHSVEEEGAGAVVPGIPSLYYGGEWGLEGRRTPHSDDELRPAIDIASAGSRFCGLTEFIGRLGRIHLEEPALHGGEYKELLLTNRQYAFARLSGAGDIITAANNDDNPAVISVPFNTCMNECTDLLSGRTFKVCDGRVQIELEGNDAVILRITEG